MFAPLSRFLAHSVLLGALLLFGCSAGPVLVSKNAAVPAGIDLTGFWRVRDDPAAERMSAIDDDGIWIPTTRAQRSQRVRSSDGVAAKVFLEFGESLKITQTYYGLFISYDRSVVEEFTYGENRLVTIGPIEAQRVSGWDGESFVVETLDDAGNTLFESWYLQEDGTVLIRDIRINKGEKDSFVHQQVFDRQ